MRTKLTLSARLTYTYALGYDYLDKWERLGDVVIKFSREPRVFNEAYDTSRYRAIVRVPSEMLKQYPARVIERAIEASLSYGCQCEHDCCGHWSQHATAHRTKRREWSVELTQVQNV